MGKILHISQAAGGVKTYIMGILRHFNANKYEHRIISSDNQFIEEAEKYVSTYKLDLKREPNLIKDIKALKKIRSIINSYKPHILHLHSAKAAALGRLSIIGMDNAPKVVFTPNAFSYLSFNGVKRSIFKSIEKVLKYNTDLLLGVSESEKYRALQELSYSDKKVKVVPNSIETTPHKKKHYDLNGTIGMIGRLTHQKNPILFVEFAKYINNNNSADFKFKLLGAGIHDHLYDDVNKKIIEYNLKDQFEILQWKNDPNYLYEFYESLDIFMLTSDFEGLPFSLLEAMEFGLPSIVTDADGNRDVITNDKDGYIVHGFNEMCEKANALLNDKNLRKRIGENAIRTIKTKHNISSSINEIEKAYESLL